MQITLSKSAIRPFRTTDAQSLAKHAPTYSVARNMNAIPHPYSLRHAEEWITIASNATPVTHFAITIRDEAVGGIGVIVGDSRQLAVSDHCGEIGYWLGESFWGRGIMSEAVAAITDWAFTELGLVRLHAFVYARNPTSARVLEKANYEYEGRQSARYFKEGEFIDSLLFAKVRLPPA
jgi:RimJ/RimL family protein N-acetyltransferase